MIKYLDQSSFWDKVFSLQFQRDTVLCGRETWQQAEKAQCQEQNRIRKHCIHEEIKTGSALKACPGHPLPPMKLYLIPAGDQVFEHMNLWDTFHLKPEHCLEGSQQEAIIRVLLCLCCFSVPFGGYSSWSGLRKSQPYHINTEKW